MSALRLLVITALSALLADCAQPVMRQPPPVREERRADPADATGHSKIPEEPSAPTIAHQEAAGPRWQSVTPPVSEPLAAGNAVRVTSRLTDGSSNVKLQVVVFDSRRCGICVIDQPQPTAGGGAIATAMREHQAVAGVNGGFFTLEFQPLGLMIASGVKSGSLQNSRLLGGMFLSERGHPRLVWRGEYAGGQGITDLVQAGPRLVDGGAPVGGLDRRASRARTFIATDGRDGWAVGVVRSATLGDLAELLASPDVIPNLRVARALNLDGGNSTAIWLRTADGAEISEPGWSTVRNFIAVIPR